MTRFIIRNIPAFTDWKGRQHHQHFDLTLVCSRGLRWDGGEYATREAALEAGAAKVSA